MWPTIELREIRVFLTLAEELHFGRTADRLDLTPSRVCQTTQTLEVRVAGQLFARTSRRVRLLPSRDSRAEVMLKGRAARERPSHAEA